jgi:hypothetical protein
MSEDTTTPTTSNPAEDNFAEAVAAFRNGGGGVSIDTAENADAPADAQSAQSAVAPADVPPAAEVAAPAAPAADPVDPALARLLAREAAIEAHGVKVDEAEGLLREKYDAYLAFEKAKANFAKDPVAFVRSMGPDVALADVAERLYMEELGAAAPIEHRVKTQTTQVSREVSELRAELDQERQIRIAAQQEQQRHEYRSHLRSHAVDPALQPLLAGLSKRNTDRFVQELYNEAYDEAVKTKGAVVLTPAQAAERAEARLRTVRDELLGPPAEAAPSVSASAKPAGNTTLWSADVGSEQAPKKAPDELDERAQLEAALKASGWAHVKPWV